MLYEIIEIFKLLIMMPFFWFVDLCDERQKRAEARLSEEEKERRRIAEEKRKAEEEERKKKEKEELWESMLVLDNHLPYSHYQKKKWWE